eukprot:jgi/Mesvir1/23318/Mv21014-RA.1
MVVHPLPYRWPDAESERLANSQAYIQNYFEGRIRSDPPPEHREVGKNSCSKTPTDMKQAPQQAVVNMYLRGIAERGSGHRGFLAWHSTGSGKTCTVLGAIEAFWDSGRKIFLATSKENAANNSITGYANCASMFPRFKNMSKSEAANLITRRVEEHRILSFSQLAHLLDLYRGLRDKSRARRSLLRNAVLIVDEVQNLFSPPAGQANEYRTLLEFLEKPSEDNRGLYMVILSGTPGRNEEEIYRLLTMIKGKPIYPESPLDEFKGLCSFVDYAGDTSVYPSKTPDMLHFVEMSPEQRSALARKLREERPTSNRERYLYEARRVTNSLSMLRLSPSYAKNHLDVLSPKIACIVKEILDHPSEKHYLYSAFNAYGIKYVATILEAEGYKPLRVYGEPPDTEAKRYVMLGSDSVPTTDSALKHVTSVYNSDGNANGKLLHVILARKKFNEGLDLKSVRHIHIMEPLLDVNGEKQAIARAVRNCSHVQLDKKDWTVTVHRYITIDGVDDRVAERAKQEHESEGVNIYMEKLREAAIDCRLMNRVHNQKEWMEAGLRQPIACPMTRGEEMRKYLKDHGLSLLNKTLKFAKRVVLAAGHNLKESFKADIESIKGIAKLLMIDRESAHGMIKDTSKAVSDADVAEEIKDAIKSVDFITGYGNRPIKQLVLEGYWIG